MCTILEFIPNEDKALTIALNMMACLSKQGLNFYIAKLKNNTRYTILVDIWTLFIMEVVKNTRKVEGYEKHADKLLLNKIRFKEYLVKHWTTADLNQQWFIDTEPAGFFQNENWTHCYGKQSTDGGKGNINTNGLKIIPIARAVYIAFFGAKGEVTKPYIYVNEVQFRIKE